MIIIWELGARKPCKNYAKMLLLLVPEYKRLVSQKKSPKGRIVRKKKTDFSKQISSSNHNSKYLLSPLLARAIAHDA